MIESLLWLRCLGIFKIEVLIPAHHAVQHGVPILGEALVREGDAQRRQHLQHRRVLLHILIAVLEKAAAGELLLGKVIQSLV